MAGNTVTRVQLSEAVYQEVGLSRNESAQLVESILAEICGSLVQGETVKVSSFGSFLLPLLSFFVLLVLHVRNSKKMGGYTGLSFVYYNYWGVF